MNRIASLALLMSPTLAALSGCTSAPLDNPLYVPASPADVSRDRCDVASDQTSSNDQSIPKANSIQLSSITPPVGANVREATILKATIAYEISDFETSKYIVIAQFDKNTRGESTDGKFQYYPFLKFGKGIYQLCYPLIDIWNEPDVKKPLTVRFLLNKVSDARHNKPVAVTDRISFPAN